jgi:hypothetical protein
MVLQFCISHNLPIITRSRNNVLPIFDRTIFVPYKYFSLGLNFSDVVLPSTFLI